MTTANNVTRLLDAKKIPYTAFELPKEKLSALEVAAMLMLAPETVYKTIVLERGKSGKFILAVVPATSSVSQKKVARSLNEKKVSVTTQRGAERVTGLQAGGISPLALQNKGFQVLVDTSALSVVKICISGGQRGLQIQLHVKDLLNITGGRIAEIV
mgnify:CR=1 FL=1